MTLNAQARPQPKRRRDLDVIGILVVGVLVFQHTVQIFAPCLYQEHAIEFQGS